MLGVVLRRGREVEVEREWEYGGEGVMGWYDGEGVVEDGDWIGGLGGFGWEWR